MSLVAMAKAQFLGSQAVPKVLPNGFLDDTPEIKLAKNYHFAEYNRVLASASPATPALAAPAPAVGASVVPHHYQGSQAVINVLSNGFLDDTPEIKLAKNYHFAEFNRALASASPATPAFGAPAPARCASAPASATPVIPNQSPQADTSVLPNGYLADTPEVRAAKDAHFAEHTKALIYQRF